MQAESSSQSIQAESSSHTIQANSGRLASQPMKDCSEDSKEPQPPKANLQGIPDDTTTKMIEELINQDMHGLRERKMITLLLN